ncbi:hypothetical protein ABLE94_14190 [Gordonia sp. VNK1]|uniref:hypothetical protein n=1 Tax=Gordonia oleivorans TaxID=3156618 RepID=UPI0032B5ED23
MQPSDALWYWMATRVRSDQFLVYAFTSPAVQNADLAGALLRRARLIGDLNIHVVDVPANLDRPYWATRYAVAEQIRRHPGPMRWQDCLDRIAAEMAPPLDAREHPWLLHLFEGVAPPSDPPPIGRDIDSGGADLVVVVLQIVHALGDGSRTSGIARQLFSDDPIPSGGGPGRVGPRSALAAVSAGARALVRLPVQTILMFGWGAVAFDRHRRLAATRSAGTGRGGVAPSRINAVPGDDRVLRTITVDTGRLRCGGALTVTIGALLVISMALPRYLGDDLERCVVTLPVGRTGAERCSRNTFRNASIDLRIDIADLGERSEAIAAAIAAARQPESGAARASRRAEHLTPAPLRILGVRSAHLGSVPAWIDGLTVVSSVDRGDADLTIGATDPGGAGGGRGGRSVFTAGFPALSSVHGLNHGVHGLGDTVTISVIADPRICPDVDRYVDLLRAAVDEMDAAVHPAG